MQTFLELGQKYRNRMTWRQRFLTMFGTSLVDFVGPITGFDTIAFDEDLIKPPDGQSTMDVVKEKYGDEAVSMIECLIYGISAPERAHEVD